VGEWRHRWEQTAAEITAVPRPAEEDGEPPYWGLERFEPGDAELFFGREETIARLETMARRHRLSVVVGASGSPGGAAEEPFGLRRDAVHRAA
jgi:hypothetical protein